MQHQKTSSIIMNPATIMLGNNYTKIFLEIGLNGAKMSKNEQIKDFSREPKEGLLSFYSRHILNFPVHSKVR